MEIKYLSQAHQTKAINATLDLFLGQAKLDNEYDIFDGEAVCSNVLTLDEEGILENLNAIQKINNITQSEALNSLDFSIEMETGTGKTYVYIKTILEMYAKYGWSKFIIITPSIAIREGVLNSLKSMKNHFKDTFNFPYDYFEYDSSRLSSLKHFIRDDALNIMVMTIDSFKRSGTVLNMPREGFVGTPKESLQKTNPILILDEPQNMESELSKTSISELHPLFTLRYSATHKNTYNLLYSLTPKEALKDGLVKQIDVLALSENQTINDIYINVLKIEIDKKSKRPVASLELIVNNKDEFVKKIVKIKGADSLKDKTKNPIYTGFIVDEINFRELFIQFENGLKLGLHEVNGQVKRQIQEQQISEAIQLHMQKFEELKAKNIKVLSLFFIDKVANFLKEEDGWIENYFCSEFDRLKKEYVSFKDVNAKDIYASYFAKRKSGFVDELKGNDSDRKLAKKTYDLIMKDKEKLLSFDENVSFIFSHSALKEGWDNPNVFFITTLNDTKSEMKKRQILGRGIRLCVNAEGERINDKNINRLTVIANESFEEFARSLQLEYEVGGVSQGNKPNNLKKRKTAKIREDLVQMKEFQALWKKLKQKTVYRISLDSSRYKEDVVVKLQDIEVREKKILKQFGNMSDGFVSDEKHTKLEYEEELPNIVNILQAEIGISRKTIIEIFEAFGIDKFTKEFVKNSDAYVKEAILAFEYVMFEMLSKSALSYEAVDGEYYEFKNIFLDEIDGYNLEATQRGLYNFESYDSDVEKDFINCADMNVKFFTKLPSSFKIKTPLGTYNPDFAVIKHDESEGAFVIETKGSKKESDLRARERWQIAYARKHFELLDVKYKKETDCNDI
ncbi:DEAD/DEAH box helicase family protein [Sulfurimonas sp. SAG-AH-194-C21]|nr:DEAD/DEAH box helicase family protein [Sulfurimonas sp. SAG-AH-194-C21]MDF1884143.1 DEAD/DEAH box helicase family protein [Sulfurimonas sp. SAG-AH-194-C21]